MRLSDVVTFQRDLLFSGAVQVGWLESNPALAHKAARYFAFHGPRYHGVQRNSGQDGWLRTVDTATFTADLVERLTDERAADPFELAIAGYGTGKSHLAVTLACLLSDPQGPLAADILKNICAVDSDVGQRLDTLLSSSQPYLVLTINGMKDFDLHSEIARQVLHQVQTHGLEVAPLQELRPRFALAARITRSLHDAFQHSFDEAFGDVDPEIIVQRLHEQDEHAYRLVSEIYEQQFEAQLSNIGQESLHDLLRVTSEAYCGPGKPFAGILILFDEFGRYLEFSVQKPYIAGSGALQQLHEAVQENVGRAFLLCFIQYELKAYLSLIAPERRDDLQRYVTRYDIVEKQRLSTNLETLIANLFTKSQHQAAEDCLAPQREGLRGLQRDILRWYPESATQAVWHEPEIYQRTVVEGCWPLHPLATWLLTSITAHGRALQQRSALALVADAYEALASAEVGPGWALRAVDLCSDALIDEFRASERLGQQGSIALALQQILERYQGQLDRSELRVLKAILLLNKTYARFTGQEDCARALAWASGLSASAVEHALASLTSERGVLSWDEDRRQYELISDAVPRARFMAFMRERVDEIGADQRTQHFVQSFGNWFPQYTIESTDFGIKNDIPTREWDYVVWMASPATLNVQIGLALSKWQAASEVDDAKGQLIYCYVGPESDLDQVQTRARHDLRASMEQASSGWQTVAPLAIAFLNDRSGRLGSMVAELAALEGLDKAQRQQYQNYVTDRETTVKQELSQLFLVLRRAGGLVTGWPQFIPCDDWQDTLESVLAGVYPQVIPLPLGNFTSNNGVSAKDCTAFTRELLSGHLDHGWITTQPVATRNRAVQLFEKSWGALNDAGDVRALPTTPRVQNALALLEREHEAGAHRLNLGQAVRLLLAPPLGASLAASGLLLGLYYAGRKDRLEIWQHGRTVGVQTWLQIALPHRLLEKAALDTSELVLVSEPEISEWNRLLDRWDAQVTHQGKIALWAEAQTLHKRLRPPAALHYRYQNLVLAAQNSQDKLAQHQREVNDACERVSKGLLTGNFNLLCWGAAGLVKIGERLATDMHAWTPAELDEVAQQEARARIDVQRLFADWLAGERPPNSLSAATWSNYMRRIADNLAVMEMAAEKNRLEQQVEQVLEQLRFCDEMQQIIDQALNLTRSNPPHQTLTIAQLKRYLEQAHASENALRHERARSVRALAQPIAAALAAVDTWRDACKVQLERHNQRLLALYNAQASTLGELRGLLAETQVLSHIFEGGERDINELAEIRKQLTLIERDYVRLDREASTPEAFDQQVEQCIAANNELFGADEPPLDNETLYAGLARTLRSERRARAAQWLEDNVPPEKEISQAAAANVNTIRNRLQVAPQLLEQSQRHRVAQALVWCERRLNQLEVEGLVVRYQELPETSQRQFLMRIGVSMSA